MSDDSAADAAVTLRLRTVEQIRDRRVGHEYVGLEACERVNRSVESDGVVHLLAQERELFVAGDTVAQRARSSPV